MCEILSANHQAEDRCYLEYSRYMKDAYYTPACEIMGTSDDSYLEC